MFNILIICECRRLKNRRAGLAVIADMLENDKSLENPIRKSLYSKQSGSGYGLGAIDADGWRQGRIQGANGFFSANP